MLLQDILLERFNSSTYRDDTESVSVNFYKEFLKREKERLKNATLNILTINYPPFSGIKTPEGIGVGKAFDIFHAIQEHYHFSYRNIAADDDLQSITQALEKFGNETDILVAFTPVTGRLYPNMKYSATLGSVPWNIVMKRPKISASGSGLLQPFTWNVWMFVIIMVISVGCIFYGLVFVQSKFRTSIDFRQFSLSSCMWFVYGAILKQGSTLNPVTDSSRIVFATWWIFIMVLTAFYTANLTAFLTLNTFTLPINDISDVGKKRYTWCTRDNIINNLTNDPSQDIYNAFRGSSKKIVSDIDHILPDYVLRRDYLFISEKPIISEYVYKYMVENYQKGNFIDCPFAVTENSFLTSSVAFVYSKSFEYRMIFDRVLQLLVEGGLIQYWFSNNLPRADICPLNPKAKERRLRNSDLILTYYIVAGGFAVSLIIFCLEVGTQIYHKMKTRKVTHTPSNALITPPPPYNSLFGPPFPQRADCSIQRREINGRDYWCVTSTKSKRLQLIPVRAPSAVLFNYTKY